MSAIHEPTLAELKNNSERSRADLALTASKLRIKATDTTADLKERLSVPHIKQEIKGHIRESSDNMVRSLKQRAMDNPLQALAVGAAVAYPVWGLVRRIPVPLALVAGGFWLAQKSRQGSVESDLTARATEQAGALAGRATEQAADLASRVQATAGQGAARIAQTVADMTAATTATANLVYDDVAQRVSDAGAAASDMGRKLYGKATDVSGAARETVATTANQTFAANQTFTAGEISKSAVLDFIERNPLLLAGSALAIGAFVAAAIPRSDIEDRLAGQGRDFVKSKVRQAASDGVDRAARLAAGVAGEVLATAAQQGLNAESIGKAVEGIASGVKSVARKGVQTALGEEAAAQASDHDSTLPKVSQ